LRAEPAFARFKVTVSSEGDDEGFPESFRDFGIFPLLGAVDFGGVDFGDVDFGDVDFFADGWERDRKLDETSVISCCLLFPVGEIPIR
jgi:hypothetical protein